MHLLGYSHH
ncbi:hypothetical protein D041_3854A, partial [Vibrio parahaemolyticus EKP-008]